MSTLLLHTLRLWHGYMCQNTLIKQYSAIPLIYDMDYMYISHMYGYVCVYLYTVGPLILWGKHHRIGTWLDTHTDEECEEQQRTPEPWALRFHRWHQQSPQKTWSAQTLTKHCGATIHSSHPPPQSAGWHEIGEQGSKPVYLKAGHAHVMNCCVFRNWEQAVV